MAGKSTTKEKQYKQKQLDFVRWYTSPASPTYDNAMQSAIRAGYSESYARCHSHTALVPIARKLTKNITEEKVNKVVDRAQFYEDLLRDAENGIAERVRMDTKGDTKLIGIQQKDQHFTAERLGNEKWNTKTIVENHGLFRLDGDSLAKLANTFQSAIEATKDAPIVAQYTVKADEQEAKRIETYESE